MWKVEEVFRKRKAPVREQEERNGVDVISLPYICINVTYKNLACGHRMEPGKG